MPFLGNAKMLPIYLFKNYSLFFSKQVNGNGPFSHNAVGGAETSCNKPPPGECRTVLRREIQKKKRNS